MLEVHKCLIILFCYKVTLLQKGSLRLKKVVLQKAKRNSAIDTNSHGIILPL